MKTQTPIINVDAYERGKQRNIMLNASKGRLKKWLAAGEDHQELYDWLNGSGQYADVKVRKPVPYKYCENCNDDYAVAAPGTSSCIHCGTELVDYVERWEPHPLCEKMFQNDFGTFMLKLAHSLTGGHYSRLQCETNEEVTWWGQLSPKQTEIVRKALARAKEHEAKKDERVAQWAAEAATREYVGEVGDKKFNVEGTISFTTSWEGNYGTTFLTVIRDANDNSIKYKGKHLGEKGDKVKMVATIKAHEEYRGEKQTIINRPRKIEVG